MTSASSLQRLATCPGSAWLPQAKSIGEYSERGSAIHAFLADVVTLGRDESLARVGPDHHAACAAVDVHRLPACDPGAYAAEVAFAYDCSTDKARELGRGLDRSYKDLRPTEIPGTTDVVGLTVDSVVIADYKTGWADIAPVRRNWQLRFYALAACRTYGRDKAHVAIVRIKDDGSVWADQDTLSAFDLDIFAEELAELMRDLTQPSNAGRLTTGAHCRYCPSFAWCPAQTNLVRALVAKPDDPVAVLAGELTSETAARAWHALKALKMATERIDDAIRLFAETQPIDLGNGSCVGPCTRETTSIDGGVAFHVLQKKYGDDIANQAVTMDATKASINRACRVVAQNTGAKISHLEREVLAAINELHGTTKRRSTSVREHKLKEEVQVS